MAVRGVAASLVSATVSAWEYPEFSWDTLPVAWHSSKPSGPYSDEELKNMSRFATVTIEKYQGLHEWIHSGFDWESCQDGTNVSMCGCCIEDEMVAMGRKLKEYNSKVMVLAYQNTLNSYPWYRMGHALAAKPEYWLRNTSGDLVLAGGGHWVMTDHGNPDAAALWEDGLLNLTKTGFVDGVFMDGCIKSPGHVASNYMPGKKEMMTRLQGEVPGPLVCGSNGAVFEGVAASQIQNWGKNKDWSKREIPMLQRAVSKGAMFQAHGPCPSNASDPLIINNLAAFLVAAGPYSYYMCGGWNGAPTEWFPIYDYPLGKPLGNATLADGVFSRSFSHGTSVTFDTATETGSITWGSTLV